MSDPITSIRRNIRRLAGNTFFCVQFRKRSNGEARTMVCRLGCRKGLKGLGPAYDPRDHDLLTVYEPRKGWRTIPLDAIERITIRGKTYPGS